MSSARTDSADGIDVRVLAGLRSWLPEHLPAIGEITQVRPISGGRSNLVFGVQSASGEQYCLRCPSSPGPAAGAIVREYELLAALGTSAVPVPQAIAVCTDPDVIGVPFFLMALVEGAAYDTADALHRIAEPERRRVGVDLARALVEVHRVDVDAVGLSRLRRPEPFVLRQLRRWGGLVTPADVVRHPRLESVAQALRDAFPGEPTVALLHGDFKIGNCLLAPDGGLRAVVDWELASTGDPRADLGWFLASWSVPGSVGARIVPPPGRVPGYTARDELVAAYERAAPLGGIDDLEYFEAFAEWKWACIDAGIHRRFSRPGHESATRLDLDVVLDEMTDRLARADALLH
ncbi:phosphotransferase family protein [Pseudonocardia dioxanivorans]|jgi:aminoglycoside phosphotransferase (APT) family kinase protein|uniref:phosphotransferase family protein n=1 Tax=Pseudonocardia dioxanivorans TaxID=240495 RepID=UPI000CD048C3|nr:phosphotransferase family protein [Pseudonocardia dioxanivorans]